MPPDQDLKESFSIAISRLSRRRGPDVREVIDAARDRLFGTDQRKKRTVRVASIGGPVLLVVLSVAMWLILRPYPTPDYGTDRIDRLMYFTLLRDEFNNLPIEERIELLAMLRERLENISAAEAGLLSAFAAGIMSEAREQLQENMSRLAIDLWDDYAHHYSRVEEDRREQYLDQALVGFVRTMETLSGRPSDASDSQILSEARDQARRDQEALRGGRGPDARAAGWMFDTMYNQIGSHASPAQRSRGALMMRDMVRRVRGQELDRGPR
jgi:hypothetical protein